MDYVWILKRDDGHPLEVHGDPEVAIQAYMKYVLDRVPGGLDDEHLILESDNGNYLARYYGEYSNIASLTRLKVMS